MFRVLLPFLCFGSVFVSSCSRNVVSVVKYTDGHVVECPKADNLNRYIDVPLFYDFQTFGAATQNIPNLSNHNSIRRLSLNDKKKISLYYELSREFDPAKPLLFVLNGGPGGNHELNHMFERISPKLLDSYNMVSMDHRGVGCSRPKFPGEEPAQSMLMRYAASDMESIRRELTPHSKMKVMGVSYGTMLGQTYALLYPDQVDDLILISAFSASSDFNDAQRKWPDFAFSSIPSVYQSYLTLKEKSPDVAKALLRWSVSPFYSYYGRVETIPNMLETVVKLNDENKREEIDTLLKPHPWTMERMMRSISCIEIFRYDALSEDEFPMFGPNFESCREFAGLTDYFDYTESLLNVKARTFIYGGFYDHVTPAEAMQRMATKVPNNFLYIDAHTGHVTVEKLDCFNTLITEFLAGQSNSNLQKVTVGPLCRVPPPSSGTPH